MKSAAKENDQAVETEEHRRSAVNGQGRPLALGLNPQMGPALLESCFQTPTFHKGSHDLLRDLRWVRRKERLWWPFSFGITSHAPTAAQSGTPLTTHTNHPGPDI